MIPYLQIAKILGPYLIGAIIGGAAIGWVQQVRINAVKADLKIERNLSASYLEANQTDQETITKLHKDVSDAHTGCDARLKTREKTARNIRVIEDTPAGMKQPKGATDEKAAAGDPLLDLLNGMFDRDGPGPGRQDRVH